MSQKQTDEMPTAAPWWLRYTRWRQTSAAEAARSERSLLSLLSKATLEVKNVPIGKSKDEYLHTLVGGKEGNMPVVWLPGYGAGVGFFWRNLEGLCSTFRLHAVDWLGTGLSGRPKFTARNRQEAEDFFLKSLARWRTEAGLDKFILVGHSLGGYLAACYALKHPEHVQHLVLVCPAGVPQAPEDWQQRFLGGASPLRRNLFKFAMWVWERGATPGALVRSIGPWGPGLVERYVTGRFSHHGSGLSEREANVFKHYFYHIVAAPGSGEFALRHLLAPGAWAHAPLAGRLEELKVPVTFIYGKYDWMQPKHAVELCRDLKQTRRPMVPSDMHVEIIDNAGHYVFLEQPELFNRALLDALSPHLTRANAQQAAEGMERAKSITHDADATEWGYAADARGSQPKAAAAAATAAAGASDDPATVVVPHAAGASPPGDENRSGSAKPAAADAEGQQAGRNDHVHDVSHS